MAVGINNGPRPPNESSEATKSFPASLAKSVEALKIPMTVPPTNTKQFSKPAGLSLVVPIGNTPLAQVPRGGQDKQKPMNVDVPMEEATDFTPMQVDPPTTTAAAFAPPHHLRPPPPPPPKFPKTPRGTPIEFPKTPHQGQEDLEEPVMVTPAVGLDLPMTNDEVGPPVAFAHDAEFQTPEDDDFDAIYKELEETLRRDFVDGHALYGKQVLELHASLDTSHAALLQMHASLLQREIQQLPSPTQILAEFGET